MYTSPITAQNIVIEVSGAYGDAQTPNYCNDADDIGVGFYSGGPSTTPGGSNPAAPNGYYAPYEFYNYAVPSIGPVLLYDGQGGGARTTNNLPTGVIANGATNSLPGCGLNYLFTETVITPKSISMNALTSTSSSWTSEPSTTLTNLLTYTGPVDNSHSTLYIGGATGLSYTYQYVYWIRVLAYSGSTPSISLSPNSGSVGSTVQVSGSSFAASDTSCTLSGSVVSSSTCSISGGTLSGSFTVASVGTSAYTVTATGSPTGDIGSEPFSVGTTTCAANAPCIYSFAATPVPLTPSRITGSSSSPSSTTYTPSNYLNQLCGVSQSIAGCVQLSWSMTSANTCTLVTDDTMVNLGNGMVTCGSNASYEFPTQIPIPSVPSSNSPQPVPYHFTLTATSASGVTATSLLTVYSLPTSTQASSQGSNLQVENTEVNGLSTCKNTINLLGCWAEFGGSSTGSSVTAGGVSGTFSDTYGIPVAFTAGYGYSEGADLDTATASYPSSDLSGLPSGYNVEYYTLANAWTAHLQACGTYEGAAASTYIVIAQDSAGNSFSTQGDTEQCVNLQAGELGNSIVGAFQDLTGEGASQVPSYNDVASAADTMLTGFVSTQVTACQDGTSLLTKQVCSVLTELPGNAGPLSEYYGETWSANAGQGCSYSVGIGPGAVEASIGVFTGAAQVAASIVQATISGIATPSSSTAGCSSSLQPAQITLTSPDAAVGSESLIQGQVTNSLGQPVSGTTVTLTVSQGTFPDTSEASTNTIEATTSQGGLFSAIYLAPSSGTGTVTVTGSDGSISQETSFSLVQQLVTFTSASGTASVSVPGTVSVSVSGTQADASVTILVRPVPNSEVAVPAPNLGQTQYIDVVWVGPSSGEAQACTPYGQGGPNTTMEYYYGHIWVQASSTSSTSTSVCGALPLSALTGTLIAVGNTNVTVPEFPSGSSVIAALGIILALAVIRPHKPRRTSRRAAGSLT